MLSAIPGYVKFVHHDFTTTIPFYCYHLPNTNSPKYNPSCHSNCFKSSLSKRNEQITDDNMILFSEGFSALEEDGPWDSGNLWSNLALYVFTLHIPFSFGGLSVVSLFSGQSHLDPEIEALSLLTIQILELYGALILLKCTAKPQFKFTSFFKNSELSDERNWFLASALGFGCLVLLIFLTSLLADRLFGSKPVNNPILKEMLQNSDVSRVSTVLAYCIFTPLLEEVVYRGFLLTSLSSTMEWQQAIAISSVIFSAVHFSSESFLQLFIVGCLLGCSYCWTRNLSSSIAIHSLYNALTLVLTYFY